MSGLSLFVAVAVIATVGHAIAMDGTPVRLSDIEALTLTAGHYTVGRRTASVPQLACVGHPPGMDPVSQLPSTVQCINRGSDGVDVQWECKAELSSDLRFGPLSVSCEGYNYPEDPLVVSGSCSLEYTLERVFTAPSQREGSSTLAGFVLISLAFGISLVLFVSSVVVALSYGQERRPSSYHHCHHSTEQQERFFPTYYPQYRGGGRYRHYEDYGSSRCSSSSSSSSFRRTTSGFGGTRRR